MASGQEGKKKKKQQRQAQPGSSNESKKEDTESQINLQAVLRLDSAALSIRFAASQVALYEFRGSTWVKTDVEGTLFVYRRRSAPDHCFLLMSRLNNQNIREPIAASLNLQVASNFLLYQSASNGIIYGLWVCDHTELHQLGTLIQQVIDEEEKASLLQEQQQPQSAPVAEKPMPSPKAGVNVLQMLDEAVRKAQTSKTTAIPVTPTKSGKGSAKSSGTPGGGSASQSRSSQKATNGHRNPAAQPASAPASAQAGASSQVVPMISSPWATQLPLPSHLGMAGAQPTASASPVASATRPAATSQVKLQQQQVVVAPGSMQNSYNVLMRDVGRDASAMPTSAVVTAVAAVEQRIAPGVVAHNAVPVSLGTAHTASVTAYAHHSFSAPPTAAAAGSVASTLVYQSPSTQVMYSRSHSSAAAAATSQVNGLGTSPSQAAAAHYQGSTAGCNGVVAQPMATLANPPRVGLTESPARASPGRPAISTNGPTSGKLDLMLPGDFHSSPGIDVKPLPQLGASPPAVELVAAPAVAGYKQLSSSSPPQEGLQGLTMEQMQQGLMYLIKNNPQFMHMLHAAYLDSLNPRTKSQ